MYEKENSLYFSTSRKEIETLFPQKIDKVLEIGCGSGATLAYLKSKNLVNYTAGIDIDLDLLNSAKANGVDEVHLASPFSTELGIEGKKFDAILLLDVLEHMIDPWSYLDKIKNFLELNGKIIISIPNTQNFRIIIPLILGRWEYKDSGLLDKTHLRFFTKKSSMELVSGAGLNIESIQTVADHNYLMRLANILTLGILKRYFIKQFILECKLYP